MDANSQPKERKQIHSQDGLERDQITGHDNDYPEGARKFQAKLKQLASLELGDPLLAESLNGVFEWYFYKYNRSVVDPELALKYGHAMLDATPVEWPLFLWHQHRLGNYYFLRYKYITQAIYDLEIAQKYAQATVDAAPVGDPALHSYQLSLAKCCTDMYRVAGASQDMEAALKYAQIAVDGMPVGHSDVHIYQRTLALAYRNRYMKAGNVLDIEASLRHSQAAICAIPLGHPDLSLYMYTSAISWTDKYQGTKNTVDLEAAFKYYQAALDAIHPGEPQLVDHLSYLAIFYTEKYIETKDMQCLDIALKYRKEALDKTPVGDPMIPEYQYLLASSYSHKYRKTGTIQDIEAAVRFGQAAVDGIPVGHSNVPIYQRTLALAHSNRYIMTRNVLDIEASLRYSQAAICAVPLGHPNLSLYMYTSAISWTDKYQGTKDTVDLEAAFKYYQAALDAMHPGEPEVANHLSYLAVFYTEKYNETKDMQCLEVALKYRKNALDTLPVGDPTIPEYQYLLADGHKRMADGHNHKYQETGAIQDMEAAVRFAQEATNMIHTDHSEFPKYQYHLAVAFNNKYHRTQNIGDLDAALKHITAAVDMTPPGHPYLPKLLRRMAAAFTDKFRRNGNIQPQKVAFRCTQAAIDMIPKGHPELPHYQHAVAIHFKGRYTETENTEDLETGITYDQAAIDASPIDHYELPWYNNSLAMSYINKFAITKDAQDNDNSINHAQAAVNGTPPGHPDIAQRQKTLAWAYTHKYYRVTGNIEDLKLSYEMFDSALNSPTASPVDLWDIAVDYTTVAECQKSFDVLSIYAKALGILPSLLWLGNSIDIRHGTFVRLDVSEYISKAVTTAIKSSKLETAVEFLEQGLSTTHKQNLQLKTEHANLEAELPVLAGKLQNLSAALQGFSNNPDPVLSYQVLAYERQELIAEIHKNKMFSDFLLPAKYSRLCLASQDGPVIMINHNKMQTDAIIIFSPLVPSYHLTFPGISSSVITEQLKILKASLHNFSIHSRDARIGKSTTKKLSSAEEMLNSVLSWLWNSVVKPVFDVLSKNGIHDGRLWWCPSGPFTYLPLHAAAPIESNFFHSYTPTLETLIHAYSKQVHPKEAGDFLTAVGVSEMSTNWETWPKLPYVEKELDTVTTFFGNQAVEFRDVQATINNVVDSMQSSAWLHLACHGEQDPDDPLKSGLLLYDGKLELGKILDLNLPKAKFVYLSACETAMGDAKLSNEAMHLAGGFLAAGFQGAIGTLWSMSDHDGPRIAETVYQTMLGEDKVLDVRLAAKGLHLAIKKLRMDGVHSHQWMPFVHMGI